MTKEPAAHREVWIGLAEVVQLPGAGVLMDRNKAFVNVLAIAENRQEYESVIRLAAGSLGFEVTGVEDAEPVRVRLQSFEIEEELQRLAELAQATGQPQFGSFYTWTSED